MLIKKKKKKKKLNENVFYLRIKKFNENFMGKGGIFRKAIFLDDIYRVAIFNWEQLSRSNCPGGNFSRTQQSSIVNNCPNILSKVLKGISRRVYFTLDLHMLAQTI